jgi:hypothetical protein
MAIYLLCFDRPFHHARHYIGFTESVDTIERRCKVHRSGHGSYLLAAVAKAGIDWKVARVWPDGDRNFERKLKNQKQGPRLCPICRKWEEEWGKRSGKTKIKQPTPSRA